MASSRKAFRITGTIVEPGESATVELQLPPLYTHTELAMPVHVLHGRKPGPRLFISSALHGDELNGIEIVRRLVRLKALKRLRGTLLAVPMVNVYGVIAGDRNLPDGRDVNRVFPGSERGSLASRLAELFMSEIVRGSDYGIDLHTGARHRKNLPQVRACLDDPATLELARVFGAPVILHSALRDGSLREAVRELDIPMLVYEAGEALRFDEVGIRVGVRGITAVMRHIGMLPATKKKTKKTLTPAIARSSSWIRAPASGIVRSRVKLGDRVDAGDELAVIADPFGENEVSVRPNFSGIVIGRSLLPLIHEGEAIIHLARFEQEETAEETVEAFREAYE